MSYTINFYLDKAISSKVQKIITEQGDLKEKSALTKTLKENQLMVFVYLRWQGKTIKVYVERKCTQNEWDTNKQRVNHNVYKRGSTEFNDYLTKLEQSISKLYTSNLNEGKQTFKSDLVKIISEANLRVTEDPKVDLLTFIDQFISDSKNRVKSSSITAYKASLSHIKSYCKARRVKLDFEDITLDFYNDYIDYLIHDLNHVNNSIGKHIRILKNLLNHDTELGLNTSYSYKFSKFKAPFEETDAIYLTEDEINLFTALDLSDNKRLDEVRDRFVAGCWLGVRFSDLCQINGASDIERRRGKEYIKLRTIKTDSVVIIPLHPIVKEIFNKYDGILPKPISNQKMNDYLKEVAVLIPELQETVVNPKTQGKVKVNTEPVEKYKLVCTHTARRSFATNLFLQGVQSYTIMQITGHKTEKSFKRYIKVSNMQHAELLHRHYEKVV